jgi:hypothetical protein
MPKHVVMWSKRTLNKHICQLLRTTVLSCGSKQVCLYLCSAKGIISAVTLSTVMLASRCWRECHEAGCHYWVCTACFGSNTCCLSLLFCKKVIFLMYEYMDWQRIWRLYVIVKVGWGDLDWIGLAKDRKRWRALVNSVLKLRVPWNAGKLSSGLTFSGLSSSAQLHRVS